ncbi:hypothetical protein [Nonomuraea africana]|uniref:hypothetical protein n=1 Tax=Nonomuraea africana TaxID=46171 RepID=UPI0033FA2EED
MSGYIVLLLILLIVLLPFAINPRLGWQLSRWQYANPEANEPSEASFTYTRVVVIITLIGGLAVCVWLYASEQGREREREQKTDQQAAAWAEADKRIEEEEPDLYPRPLTLVPNAGGGQILAFWAFPKAAKLTVVYRPSPCFALLRTSVRETSRSVTIAFDERTTLRYPAVSCSSSHEAGKTKVIKLHKRFGRRVVYTSASSQPVESCDESARLSKLCGKVSKDFAREKRKDG